jgi:hypothetical protein
MGRTRVPRTGPLAVYVQTYSTAVLYTSTVVLGYNAPKDSEEHIFGGTRQGTSS